MKDEPVKSDHFLIDGTPCTLDRLCRDEPAWAANIIRGLRVEREKLLDHFVGIQVNEYAAAVRSASSALARFNQGPVVEQMIRLAPRLQKMSDIAEKHMKETMRSKENG